MASMTYRELRRLLVDHGCKYLRDARGGGHEIWLCPGRKPISVPKTLKGEGTPSENIERCWHQINRWKEYNPGLLAKMLADLGLNRLDLR
jgi:hypothetical protein